MIQKALYWNSEGNIFLVGLDLVLGVFQGSVGVGGIFEFEQHQRQSVDVNHRIGPAVFLVFNDGELADGDKFIAFRLLKIKQTGFVGADFALWVAESHIHPFGEQAVKSKVIGQHIGEFHAQHLAQHILPGIGGQMWIQFVPMAVSSRPRNTTS